MHHDVGKVKGQGAMSHMHSSYKQDLKSLRGGWRGVARGQQGGSGMVEVASCWWAWGRG